MSDKYFEQMSFFYKGDTPKKCEFFWDYFFHIFSLKIFTLSNTKKTYFFLHWVIWGPSLKIKISKIRLCHVFSRAKLGLETKVMKLGNGKHAQSLSDIHWIFNTVPYGDHPQKLKFRKSDVVMF